MKKIFIFCFILSLGITSQSKADNPPNTVEISDNLYVDKYEITNIDWKEYTHWLKNEYGESAMEYQLSLPDTTILNFEENEIMGVYFSHPSFNEYPVIGITYQQAIAYCNWRSNRVNEVMYLKDNKLKELPTDLRTIPNKYHYRLPTIYEWEQIAGIEYDKKTKKKIAKSLSPNGNFWNDSTNTVIEITTPVNKSYPNKLGIYNLFGNVAEMTSIVGIAKGGSYIHTSDESNIENDFPYQGAASWLGFRCVCTISE